MYCELETARGYAEGSAKTIEHTRNRYLSGREYAEGLIISNALTWLDIGTNYGHGLSVLDFEGKGTLLAIDIDSTFIKEARKNNPHAHTALMDGRRLGIKPESISVVSCFEVIEHMKLPEADGLLGDINRSLVPGGVLLISTPNRGASGKRRTSPDHRHEYTPDELQEKLRFAGFKIVEKLGTGFIKEGSLLSEIYRSARDSYLVSYFYYNILPQVIRMKIRDEMQSKLGRGEVRKPLDGEVVKNLYYVCQKSPQPQ